MAVLTNTMMQGTAADTEEGDFQIKKSCRFDHHNPNYFNRHISSGSGDRKKWTASFWFKIAEVTSESPTIISATHIDDSTDYHVIIRLETSGALKVDERTGGSSSYSLETTAVYRDHSAWYHFVVQFDSANAWADERVRIYKNGVRQTVSGTYPSQNYASWLTAGTASAFYTQTVGREAARQDYETSGYLADVYVCDGALINPGAWGSFDTTGAWNAKAFSIPAPNDGTADWVGSSSGTFSTATSLAFNGIATTDTASNAAFCNAGNNGTITLPGDGIVVNATLRINLYASVGSFTQYTKLWVNGEDFTHSAKHHGSSGNSGYWDIPDFGGKTLTSVKWEALTGANVGLGGIEVDGQLLTNGATDGTTFSNPNKRSITWSSGTASGAGSPISDKDHAFDDDSSTVIGDSGGASAEWVITLPESITNVSLVEIRPGASQPNDAKFKCDIGGTTHTYTVAGGSHPEWVRVYAGTPGTLTAIRGQRTSSNTGGAISGVRVNGVILVDGRPDTRFHLKFDTDKPIGYNSFDDTSFTSFKSINGAPILNTNAIGTAVTSGTRTDDNAANLKIAIPGNGLVDVHHSVTNATGSQVTLTAGGGIATSKNDSIFYGKSIYFDGSNDYLSCTPPFTLQDNTGNYTLELWAKPDASVLTDDTYRNFFGAGPLRCGMFRSGHGNGRKVYFESDGNWNGFGILSDIKVKNEWFHVALV